MTYKARRTPLARKLYEVWGIDSNFNVVVFRKDGSCLGIPLKLFHRQPLPDYLRWLASGGEPQYLPYELRSSLPSGVWDSVPGSYLPSHVLDLAYVLLPKPNGYLLRFLALLCW